jgi:uncharacterized protein (TIGR00255 family)
MIHSMTGYGEAQYAEDGVSYALEIRTLNNRYFKASIKLPENLQYLEAEAEKLLRKRLQRGSVTMVLRVRNSSATAAYEINRPALEHYLRRLEQARLPAGVTATVDLGTLLALPGVCQPPEQAEAERERIWKVAGELIERALDMVVRMRRQEGEALRRDLIGHCDRIREEAGEIAQRAPKVIADYQAKLSERIAVLLSGGELPVDQDSLLREVALYADRCDISEEIARLTSHLDQFAGLCDSREHTGRKLDFLAQEMLREANTIGSKSNDAVIARHVVEIKGSIDRLKEQVQNVE